MKKRMVRMGCILLTVLLLGACAQKPGSVSSFPAASSSQQEMPESAGSVLRGGWRMNEQELQEKIVEETNRVLDKYRSGLYPEPIYWDSEPGINNWVPADAVLPEKVEWKDLEADYSTEPEYSEYTGLVQYDMSVSLPLAEDYRIHLLMSVPAESVGEDDSRNDERLAYTYRVEFEDLRAVRTIESVKVDNGEEFTNIQFNRLIATADMSGFVMDKEGARMENGKVKWEIANHLFHVSGQNGQEEFSVIFEVGQDGKLLNVYPGERGYSGSAYDYKGVEVVGQPIFDAFSALINDELAK